MVPGIPFLMRTRKKIALALSVAFLVVSMSACHQVFQPTLSDIARANFSHLEEPLNVSISLGCINDTVAAYYNSVVHCFGDDVSWNGKATVYFMESYFVQECISQKDSEQGAKLWRGVWAAKDVASPTDILCEWISKIESGACIYEKTPQVITIDGAEHQVYEISFQEDTIDWASLCDADFDSLFGGRKLFGDIGSCDITLYIETDSLLLSQVIISSLVEDAWCEASIDICLSSASPNILWGSPVLDNVCFYEEWALLGPSH